MNMIRMNGPSHLKPVTFPAYPDTTVAVRALREWKAAARTAISRKALARMRLDFS